MNIDSDLLSIQEVRDKLGIAKRAQVILEQMTQSEVDEIVWKMSEAGVREAKELARMAVHETGFGNIQDKETKNLFAAKHVYEAIKDIKTVGIISEDLEKMIWEISEPVGVIAGIIPSTNPTSTIIFKAIIAIKARNAIVFSPHPNAQKCSCKAAEIMQNAAASAGAPEGIIQCLEYTSLQASNELMTHSQTDLILATGGPSMVKAAYSSGKPAYGVGPGNVPVYVHISADVSDAARKIVESKSFDFGTICASEQAIVVDEEIKVKLKNELERHYAYFLNNQEKERVAAIIQNNNGLNPEIVGRSPQRLGEMAGIEIPKNTTVLVGEEEEVSNHTPFSIEKLSPILALYTVKDWQEGCEICKKLLDLGGLGHTLGIHAKEDEVIREFALKKPASRIIVNSGTTFGAIGSTTGIFPSLTLGCGTYGNNISSDNIGPEHLMNIKRVAFGIREMNNTHIQEMISEEKINEQGVNEEEIRKIVIGILNQLKN